MNLLDFSGHDDMNKRARTLILSLYAVLASVNVNGQAMIMRAPELFGDARAVVIRSDDSLFGLISSPGALFVFRGRIEGRELSCLITQIAGPRVTGEIIDGKYTHGSELPVPCYARFRNGRWTGWIDFRGHPRAFCAADQTARLPEICRLRP